MVDCHLFVELRMLLKNPAQLIKYAWVRVLHGIEHASDHLAVGDRPAIGCAEGQAPDLKLFNECLREVQGSVFNLCHRYNGYYLAKIVIILIKTIQIITKGIGSVGFGKSLQDILVKALDRPFGQGSGADGTVDRKGRFVPV